MPTTQKVFDQKTLGVQFVDGFEPWEGGWRQQRRVKVARTWTGTQVGRLPHGFVRFRDELMVVRDGLVSLLSETDLAATVRQLILVKGELRTSYGTTEASGCALEYITLHTSVVTRPDRLEIEFLSANSFKWRWVISATPGSWSGTVTLSSGVAEVTDAGVAKFKVKVLRNAANQEAMATGTTWWFNFGYQGVNSNVLTQVLEYQDFVLFNVGYELFKVRWQTGWDDANLAARNNNSCAVNVGYWPVACNSFALFYDHLVLSQPVLYSGYQAPEYKFAVSHIYDLDSFQISVNSEADEFTVDEGKAQRVALLGERMFCYTNKSVYELLFVGGVRVWQFMPRFKNFGLDHTNSFATDGNIHFAVFQNRIAMFDGAQFQLVDEQIKDIFCQWRFGTGGLKELGVVAQYNPYKKEVSFGYWSDYDGNKQWLLFYFQQGTWRIGRSPCRQDSNATAGLPFSYLYLPIRDVVHSDRNCCWWAGEFALGADGARQNRFGTLLPASGLAVALVEDGTNLLGNRLEGTTVGYAAPVLLTNFIRERPANYDELSVEQAFATWRADAGNCTLTVLSNSVPTIDNATATSTVAEASANKVRVFYGKGVKHAALRVSGVAASVDLVVFDWCLTVGGFADNK